MSHRRNGGNGGDGVPDWFYWALAFLALAFGLYFLVLYDWKITP